MTITYRLSLQAWLSLAALALVVWLLISHSAALLELGFVLLGALLFSLVNALQLWVQVLDLNIPSDVAVMLPYLLTVIALALPFRRMAKPESLTVPFQRGEN